jgi:hypothetical protein
MGRGLGKNQQFILDTLQDEGEPTSVMDLACRQADTEDPDRSVKVSMRRSAKSLADRGRIQCKRIEPRLRRENNSLLYCWLPSHEAPRRYRPEVDGDPEEAVWDAIQSFQSLSDEEWREEWRLYASRKRVPDGLQVTEETIPYKHVMSEAIKKLGGHMHDNPHATAVWRATRRLEDEGELEVHRDENGGAWAVSVVS